MSRLRMPRVPGGARRSRVLALLVVPVLAAGLAACGSDPNSIAAQAKDGSRKGYISQDGAVEVIAPADRGKPVGLSGTMLDGKPWASIPAPAKGLALAGDAKYAHALGPMQFTRTPCEPHSTARSRVKPTTPAFEAQ